MVTASTPKPAPTQLVGLLNHAEDYAHFAMRKFGQMAHVLSVATDRGHLMFTPHGLPDT